MQNKASSCSQIVIPKHIQLTLAEIWARRRDNFRELGNEEWRGQYARDIDALFQIINTRFSAASAIEDAVEEEQGRWQDAIRDKVIKASQIPNADSWVDGAGCDSSDPLDVSLAEIGQVIHYLVDELAELRSDASKET